MRGLFMLDKKSSSKGTQDKWSDGDFYFKRDRYAGEAEAEYLVSVFLSYQNFSDFVRYEKVSSDVCKSHNFIPAGGSFITFYRLLQQKGYTDEKINQIGSLQPKQQLDFIYSILLELGFSKNYLNYTFSRLFAIDSLVLNVDRHWNNFGILAYNSGNLDLLTPFDFGYSLGVTFSSTTPDHVIRKKSKSFTVAKNFSSQNSLVSPFNFNVNEEFVNFLESRGTREARIFRQRIKILYNM